MLTISAANLISIISIVVSIVLGFFAIRNGIIANRLAKRKMDLEANLDQIKKFDQPTAMAILQKTRTHEHNVWNFKNSFENFVKAHRDDNEGLRLLGEVGVLRGEADAIMTDMIRVYRLSGAVITDQIIDQWVKDGFIPEHYRNRFLSHIR